MNVGGRGSGRSFALSQLFCGWKFLTELSTYNAFIFKTIKATHPHGKKYRDDVEE